jgi:hypothetical protein
VLDEQGGQQSGSLALSLVAPSSPTISTAEHPNLPHRDGLE